MKKRLIIMPTMAILGALTLVSCVNNSTNPAESSVESTHEHHYVAYATKHDATCTQVGYKQSVKKCTSCDSYMGEDGTISESIATFEIAINQNNHKLWDVSNYKLAGAKKHGSYADGINQGERPYYECEYCKEFYSDEALTTKCNPADFVTTVPYVRDEATKKITMGRYPQEAADVELYATLNHAAGMAENALATPDSTVLANYFKSFNFYSTNLVSDYAYYTDVDLDKDGVNDYRGVYFTKYRPSVTSTAASDSLGSDDSTYRYNGGMLNNVIWFKYEPITWLIVSDSKTNGEITLIAEKALTTMQYSHYTDTRKTSIYDDSTCNPADYDYSDIYSFLRTEINVMFNESELGVIKTTEYESSYYPGTTEAEIKTISSYSNTTGKITIPTYDDIAILSKDTYYNRSTLEEICGVGTAYSFQLGLKRSSLYAAELSGDEHYSCAYVWTRSIASSKDMLFTYYDKTTKKLSYASNSTIRADYGVRPMITIDKTVDYLVK